MTVTSSSPGLESYLTNSWELKSFNYFLILCAVTCAWVWCATWAECRACRLTLTETLFALFLELFKPSSYSWNPSQTFLTTSLSPTLSCHSASICLHLSTRLVRQTGPPPLASSTFMMQSATADWPQVLSSNPGLPCLGLNCAVLPLTASHLT